jgi:hypothetical protein
MAKLAKKGLSKEDYERKYHQAVDELIAKLLPVVPELENAVGMASNFVQIQQELEKRKLTEDVIKLSDLTDPPQKPIFHWMQGLRVGLYWETKDVLSKIDFHDTLSTDLPTHDKSATRKKNKL